MTQRGPAGKRIRQIGVDPTVIVDSRSARRKTFAPFLAYVAAFHLIWIVWPFVMYPRLTAAFGDKTLAYALVQLSIRVLLWVVPVWFYLRYVDRVEPVVRQNVVIAEPVLLSAGTPGRIRTCLH